MQKIYTVHEGLNETYPIAVYGEDGETKARFSDEISAERWITRNGFILGILSVGRG